MFVWMVSLFSLEISFFNPGRLLKLAIVGETTTGGIKDRLKFESGPQNGRIRKVERRGGFAGA